MTLQIIPAFVPKDHPIRSHLPMAPKYITIHETANRARGANDQMHAEYLLTPEAIDRTVLWHATVDEDSIRQHLPWNEVGWHAGDGYNGPGNRQSIGLELCVNADGNFWATLRLAAKLVAHLVREVPSLLPFPECVVQHNVWSGKDCPAIIRSIPGGWEGFLILCQEEIQGSLEPTLQAAPVLLNNRTLGQAVIMNGRAFLPVRVLSEALGLNVDWDGEQVLVTSPAVPSESRPATLVINMVRHDGYQVVDGRVAGVLKPLLEELRRCGHHIHFEPKTRTVTVNAPMTNVAAGGGGPDLAQ